MLLQHFLGMYHKLPEEGESLDRRAEGAACTRSRSSEVTQQLCLGAKEVFVYFVSSSDNAFNSLCNVFVSLLCLAAPPTPTSF